VYQLSFPIRDIQGCPGNMCSPQGISCPLAMGLEYLSKILIHVLNKYLLTAYLVPDAAQGPEKEQWAGRLGGSIG